MAFNRLCSLLKLGKLDINEFLGPPIQYSLDQLVGLIWRDGHYFPSSINSDHITAKTCDMVNDVGLNDLGFGTHPTGVYQFSKKVLQFGSTVPKTTLILTEGMWPPTQPPRGLFSKKRNLILVHCTHPIGVLIYNIEDYTPQGCSFPI